MAKNNKSDTAEFCRVHVASDVLLRTECRGILLRSSVLLYGWRCNTKEEMDGNTLNLLSLRVQFLVLYRE